MNECCKFYYIFRENSILLFRVIKDYNFAIKRVFTKMQLLKKHCEDVTSN